MRRQTDGFFDINEALFSSALGAIVFSLLAAQPLTVVGITGLISLFNYTVYNITVDQGVVALYPQILAWVAIWAAITHWIIAVCNLYDYMRYITDYSTNTFGMYVGIIYVIKGVEELVAQFYEDAVRGFLSDYAYPLSIIWCTGFSHIPGRITEANLKRIPITQAFHPTTERSGAGLWIIDFWNLEVKWVLVALPMGILLTLLFYYDHNVSSIAAQATQYPLKKPAGFHWDFFILGYTSFVAGVIGIPLPNGLVLQAPVHPEGCTVYEDELVTRKITAEGSDDPRVLHEKVVRATEVKEQRVSHLLMGLAFVGLMTGPLLKVLHTMPRALFAGIFLHVGWGFIEDSHITANLMYIMQQHHYIEPGERRAQLKKSRIVLHEATRILGVLASVAISQTIAAIGFPIIIIALIPVRWITLPRVFTEQELLIMDQPTAEAPVVTASFGGQPERPETILASRRRRNAQADGPNEE
ncbi:hypothetical protein LTR49_027176 [Elasticomyces elasticus]|nr:hypothetical protein LTR49_027176 [Elasticomyces elasticus]